MAVHQRFPDRALGDDDDLVGKSIGDEMVRLYVSGDKYKADNLRRDTIDLLFKTIRKQDGCLTSPPAAKYAFKYLRPENPLCRLLVHMFCRYEGAEDDGVRTGDISVAFLQAICSQYIHLLRGAQKDVKNKLRLYDYDDHATDEEGEACEKKRGDAGSDDSDSD